MITADNRGSDYKLHLVCRRENECLLNLYTVFPGSWMPPTPGTKLWEGKIVTDMDCDLFAMRCHASQKSLYFVFEMERGLSPPFPN